MDRNQEAFFALLRAGFWADVDVNLDVNFNPGEGVDWSEVQRLAEEQSVVGLVAAGIDRLKANANDNPNVNIPKPAALQFIGQTLQLEERNKAMNYFIGVLVDKMKDAGIYTLLVKGQGIAQCYEKPLWRSCGDVDFFLDTENYEKAKEFLIPLASFIEPEGEAALHFGVTIDPWVVELHGTLRCGLSAKMDNAIDDIQADTFDNHKVRIWKDGDTEVPLPCVDNDVIFVFTHFLKHFYKGGLGLRQICDWCRLLWVNRKEIDLLLLETRLRSMKLLSEWKAFAAYAVISLGMPVEAMPLYSDGGKWKRKAKRIQSFLLEVGNFGHNRDMSYYSKYPYVIRKAISLGQRVGDVCRHALIFPVDSMRFFPGIILNGLKSAARGE